MAGGSLSMRERPRSRSAGAASANRADGQRLEERLRFETLLTELSVQFLNLPADQVDAAIEDAQRRVCECLDIDLSATWQVSAERPHTLLLTHIYRPPGFPTLPEVMDARETFPWCLETMGAGRSIVLSRVTDAPAAAARDLEWWRHLGIKSIVTLPLSTGGSATIGALNFSATRTAREWPVELVTRLERVAQVFASALAR